MPLAASLNRIAIFGVYGAGKPIAITGAGMATRTTVTLEDDLEGGPADRTVRFGLDGAEYEIDLNSRNAAKFSSQLAPFISRARKAGSEARPRPARTPSGRERSARIRAWAKGQGISVSDRGRLAASVIGQYEKAATARQARATGAGRG